MLTNHHVIEGCGRLEITSVGNLAAPALLLRSDPSNDLAVLKARGGESAHVAEFRSESPKLGESVDGFPLVGALSRSGNFVSGNITALSGLGDDARSLQFSAPIQPGNSGGPLLDAWGNVIGVVSSKIDDLSAFRQIGSMPQNRSGALRLLVTRYADRQK